jgi:outer membrane protein
MEQNTSDRIGIEGARRTVVQTVAQAWNTMVGDQASVTSNEEQVRAAQVAFEGIREQYRVGLSTTQDVLLQQTSLENAELVLVQARHDAYVAQAALLQAMGRLEAQALVTGAPVYDPATSFNRVKAAGAVPWEPLIAALDSVGAPSVGVASPIPAPPAPSPQPASVTMIPPTVLPSAPATLSTAQPTTPAPNTTAPSTPQTLGAQPGPAAPTAPPPPAPTPKP